jgi:hypothetical protein
VATERPIHNALPTPGDGAARRRRRRTTLPPLLLDGPTAAALCGVSPRTWAALKASEKTPACIRLNARTLWNRRELIAWCDAGCPDREAWKAIREQERRRRCRR